jgi:hypothetical protein
MSDFKKYLNVYEFDAVLPGTGETIKFKPLTTGQMKKILVYENEDDPMVIEHALDELIGSTVINENFDIRKMYLQDRFFLLVQIRRKTKGDLYQFEFACPECGSQSLESVDLASLHIKQPPIEIDPIVKLDDNISIELDFVTRDDQLVAYNYVRNKFGDTLTPLQLATETSLVANAIVVGSVITPEGADADVSLEDKQLLLEEIPRGQYDEVTGWFEKNDFGLDFSFKMSCKHMKTPRFGASHGKLCGFTKEMDIPTTQFFF